MAAHLRTCGYASDLHETALAKDWERFDQLTTASGEAVLAEVNADHPVGGTVMFAAAAGGAGASIWRVYGAGGDPDVCSRGDGGASPLQAALRYPDLATAEITAATLLANAASPRPASSADDSPLHIAAARGSTELAEMLIRLGADAEARDARGLRPAEVAERAGHTNLAERIRNHAAIPRTCRSSRTAADALGNAYREPEWSGLSILARSGLVGLAHGQLDRVKEHVARDPRFAHAVATTSEIAVEACAHTGRKEIVDFLLEHGAPYSLPTAVMRSDVDTVRRLLDEDPRRIQERGAHDFALLWYPVIGECEVSVMELLVQRGAVVEEQHQLGTTALHWACRGGRADLVEWLLDHGADVGRVGRKFRTEGETPLQIALAAEHAHVADLLRSCGAR